MQYRKSRKFADLDKILCELWRTRTFDNILLRLCYAVNQENLVVKLTKGYIATFPPKVTSESQRTKEL